MAKSGKLLYVEDDEVLSFVTKDNLELNGYAVTHCESGAGALNLFMEEDFDLCILDVMLPEMDGFALAQEIRKVNQQIPIIFLTAKSLKEDKIKGLKLGGDDYLTKPFSIEELQLKIQVFLKRRFIHQNEEQDKVQIGAFNYDYVNLKLNGPNFEKDLTQREGDLLKMLVDNKNKLVKRSDILIKLWGEDDYFLGRSLDVFISRLRKYLKNDPNLKIENVHGVGFRFLI